MGPVILVIVVSCVILTHFVAYGWGRGELCNVDTFCCLWVGSWWVVQYWHILLPVGGVLVSCAILTHFVACRWSRCELCNIDIFCCLWVESWWVVQYWHILLPMDRVVVSCAILTDFVACGWGRGELCNIDTFCCLWVEGGFRERKMLYRWRGSKRSSLITLWTVFLARHRMEVERTQDTQKTVLNNFWTFYVRSIYLICLGGYQVIGRIFGDQY